MGTGTSNSRACSRGNTPNYSQRIVVKKVDKSKVSKDKEEQKIKRDQDMKELKGNGSSSCQNDVMISYSHADTDCMKKIKVGLEEAGIKVWVDLTGLKAGVDFLSKIGQAIIDATMFIQLLSPASIRSKYCQDELALAYVSNKPIFPVGLQKAEDLFPLMDTGMKLQLARFNWNLFSDAERFPVHLAALVNKLQTFKDLHTMEISLDSDNAALNKQNLRTNVNHHLQNKTAFGNKMATMMELLNKEESVDFWENNFQNKLSVSWPVFSDTFKKHYSKSLTVIFSPSDQDWLESIIFRELIDEEDDDNIVKWKNYCDFCSVDGEQHTFWYRVQDQAVESYTMKEVFDMNSSVRVEAIQNLGKFHSKAVVEALLDLLYDRDNNIRAIAAISLAKAGENSPKIVKSLMKCLNDKDRLVREGACLALGHLKAQQAVTKILHLWRNDFISSVREAAQVALEQIGGTEANQAMYITKVLSDEIRMLTKD